MNTLKLAFISLGKKILTLVLIILELTALFMTEIYMINALEERSILNAPYSKLLNENCFVVYDSKYIQKQMENQKLTMTESHNELLKDLKGDYQVYDIMCVNTDLYYIVSVNDDIYKALKLPLSSGSYGTEKNSAVASKKVPKGNLAVQTADGSLELNICGTLTENTYIPSTSSYNIDMTINDLYFPTYIDNLIITNRSAIKGFEDQFTCDLGFLIVFKSDIEENVNLLKSKAAVLDGPSFAENTRKALNDDLRNFLPLLCCLILIVIIGIVCVSLTIFNENRYSNGVLWLCGYSKARILAVHAQSIIILPIISLIVSALAILIFKLINSEFVTNIRFTLPCFASALITCFFLLIVSMAVPMIKTAGKSPVEYLGRSK